MAELPLRRLHRRLARTGGALLVFSSRKSRYSFVEGNASQISRRRSTCIWNGEISVEIDPILSHSWRPISRRRARRDLCEDSNNFSMIWGFLRRAGNRVGWEDEASLCNLTGLAQRGGGGGVTSSSHPKTARASWSWALSPSPCP